MFEIIIIIYLRNQLSKSVTIHIHFSIGTIMVKVPNYWVEDEINYVNNLMAQ